MFYFTGQQVMKAKNSKHSREYGQIVCLFCNFLNLFAIYLCPVCVCCMCIVILCVRVFVLLWNTPGDLVFCVIQLGISLFCFFLTYFSFWKFFFLTYYAQHFA